MNIICYIFNHKYRLKRKITSDIRELKCERCKREFVMSDVHECVIPLDDTFKELHEDLLYMRKKKEELRKDFINALTP